tara:strand:+ start:233 stop:424 length:192 start_codon:yes stop_codon:yes gene_type:complete
MDCEFNGILKANSNKKNKTFFSIFNYLGLLDLLLELEEELLELELLIDELLMDDLPIDPVGDE